MRWQLQPPLVQEWEGPAGRPHCPPFTSLRCERAIHGPFQMASLCYYPGSKVTGGGQRGGEEELLTLARGQSPPLCLYPEACFVVGSSILSIKAEHLLFFSDFSLDLHFEEQSRCLNFVAL